MAGSKPGERRGGRQKGTPNKITADIKALAAVHSEDALKTLAQIAKSGESEAARVAAANSLLDRAYGKPRQEHEHSGPDGGAIKGDLTVRLVRSALSNFVKAGGSPAS